MFYFRIMAFLSGYKPKGYVLCLQPTEGTLYLSDGNRRVPVELRKQDLPIFIPAKSPSWHNPFWKTDTCPGKFFFLFFSKASLCRFLLGFFPFSLCPLTYVAFWIALLFSTLSNCLSVWLYPPSWVLVFVLDINYLAYLAGLCLAQSLCCQQFSLLC